MLITVFTPTYNRGHLLPRLYESLCRQTFRDFEWVVVDDGSTDGTKDLFAALNDNANVNGNYSLTSHLSPLTSKEKTTNYTDKSIFNFQFSTFNFPIRYFYQENGGKHRAINRGVKEAQGELFFIADSDDSLPPDALEQVARVYETVRGDESFGGVCGLDGTFNGKVIGSGLPHEVIDTDSITVRNRMGVTGDMKEVFRTAVLKEFPFPEIEGERFCPEVLLWNRIATKYKLRYFNRVIYLVEYQDDGISAGIVKARVNSPVAAMMTYAEMTQYEDVPLKGKLKAAINYWRFRFCAMKVSSMPSSKVEGCWPRLSWYWNWTIPIGLGMHLKDFRSVQ